MLKKHPTHATHEPSCVAHLSLTLQEYRFGFQRVLRHPVVHGTLAGNGWLVTMDNPFALGQMARLGGFDCIELLSTPYVEWSACVECLRNEELRAMLELWDAKLLAALRDGFNSTSTRRKLGRFAVPAPGSPFHSGVSWRPWSAARLLAT
jgi:hypothetical protein